MSYALQQATPLSGPLDDLWSALQPAAQAITATTQEQGNELLNQALRSSQFNKVLDAVEQRAEQAVIDQTKKNAALLITLAVAGGAVGGTIFKGPYGTALAVTLATGAGIMLLGGGVK